MKQALFCVTCEVDNGCTIETWETFVHAYTASQAEMMAKSDWQTRDNETFATVKSCRLVPEFEIITRRIYHGKS